MAQKIGIWGCFVLGLVMMVGTFMRHGFDDPVRYVGAASLILFGAAFWLFKKNAEAVADAEKADRDGE